MLKNKIAYVDKDHKHLYLWEEQVECTNGEQKCIKRRALIFVNGFLFYFIFYTLACYSSKPNNLSCDFAPYQPFM